MVSITCDRISVTNPEMWADVISTSQCWYRKGSTPENRIIPVFNTAYLHNSTYHQQHFTNEMVTTWKPKSWLLPKVDQQRYQPLLRIMETQFIGAHYQQRERNCHQILLPGDQALGQQPDRLRSHQPQSEKSTCPSVGWQTERNTNAALICWSKVSNPQCNGVVEIYHNYSPEHCS